jgi:tetratricopeptide (TPR) repeat protein
MDRRPAQRQLSAEALTLLHLREKHRWSQKKLAAARGLSDYRRISRFETGENQLSRQELYVLAGLLGDSREAVDALLFTDSLITASPPEPASPVALTPAELRRIDRAVIADGWTRAADLRAKLIADKKRRKAAAAHREAGELWARLKTLSRPARREVVADAPEFQSWALAVRLCEESRRAAANDPQEALHLADLALWIAGRVEGEEFRSRLRGYVWAHRANALRVGGHLDKAAEAFVRAWELWKAGASVDAGLLPEWRMLSLEATLRRVEHRFTEALELLARAEEGAGGEPAALAAILLKKEFVYEQMGDLDAALAALAEAAPYVKISGDARLLWVLRFETAKAFCGLERYEEAATLVPGVRELAERLGNKLDIVRVVWLAARVAAGQGRREDAIAGLEQVRREFADRPIPYDAALSSLELSVLYLEEGRTGAVKALAREMGAIFKSQGIAREALASLSVFFEAAQKETATVELARRVIAEVEGAMRKAPRPVKDERG